MMRNLSALPASSEINLSDNVQKGMQALRHDPIYRSIDSPPVSALLFTLVTYERPRVPCYAIGTTAMNHCYDKSEPGQF